MRPRVVFKWVLLQRWRRNAGLLERGAVTAAIAVQFQHRHVEITQRFHPLTKDRDERGVPGQADTAHPAAACIEREDRRNPAV